MCQGLDLEEVSRERENLINDENYMVYGKTSIGEMKHRGRYRMTIE